MYKLYASTDFGSTYLLKSVGDVHSFGDLIEEFERKCMRWYIEKGDETVEMCPIVADIITQTLATANVEKIGFATDDPLVRRVLTSHGIPVYSSLELMKKISEGWAPQSEGVESVDLEVDLDAFGNPQQTLH